MINKYIFLTYILVMLLIIISSGRDTSINIEKFIIDEVKIDEKTDYVIYWIGIINTGTKPLENVVVTDKFSDGLGYLDAEVLLSFDQTRLKILNNSLIPRSDEIRWSLGDLEAKAERWIRLIAKIDRNKNANVSPLDNRVSIEWDGSGIQTSSATYPLSSVIDVSSTIMGDKSNKVDYIITVRNKGNRPLYRALLEVNLAKGLVFSKANPEPARTPDPGRSDQALIWILGDMSPGDEKNVVMTLSKTNNNGDLKSTKVLAAAFIDNKLTTDGYKSSYI